jgi:hypothetical protein
VGSVLDPKVVVIQVPHVVAVPVQVKQGVVQAVHVVAPEAKK